MKNETSQNTKTTIAAMKKDGNAYRCTNCGQKIAEPLESCPVCKTVFSNAAELKDKYNNPHDATLSKKLHEKYEQMQEWVAETEERTRIEAEESHEQLKRTQEKYRKQDEDYQKRVEEKFSDEAAKKIAANLTPRPRETEEKFRKRKERYLKSLKTDNRLKKWCLKHPIASFIIVIVLLIALSNIIFFLIRWLMHTFLL